MHDNSGCSRLVFRATALPATHPGSTCSLTQLLPASGGAAWLGARRQMVGLGRALTLESASADAIAQVRAAWETVAAPAPGEGPAPVLFASFAFRSPARSVAFVPSLTVINEAGARWAITAGIGRAPDPLEAVDAAMGEATRSPRVPDSLSCGHGSMSRGQWRDSVRQMAARLRQGAADKAVSARRGAVSSRVLAGTCAPGDGERLAGSDKDLREHALASDSVSTILARLCSEVSTRGPFLLELPNVVHLATDVSARLADAHLLGLVAALHPTAAVCGTPRDLAMRLIEELEDTERGRYSGPVGWVDASGDGEFAIALRCGLASGTRLRLYAGAGIMPDSDPDAELAETEAKMRPLLDALGV